MSVLLSYNFDSTTVQEHSDYARIQSMFERFGWENVGGSSYRYPALTTPQAPEDWFNQVVPALMLFRAYTLRRNITVTKFSLDAHSSTGLSGVAGKAITATAQVVQPSNNSFGAANLQNWLDAVTNGVPY